MSNPSAPDHSDRPAPIPSPAPVAATPRRRRGWLLVTTVALAAALTGAAASQAVTQGHGYWNARGFMGPFDPAHAEDRADRFMRHAAIELDATPEQQDKLRTIARSAVRDLLPMREKALSARERARTLLTQPSIDRGAIEALRAEQMVLAETASRRFAQALGDAAEVLTPAQRRDLEALMQAHRAHWRPWRRG